MNSTWLALTVVGFIAMFAAALGLLLYRFSGAVVQQRSLRLSGATAIAWLFFLGMAKLYTNVSQGLFEQQLAIAKTAQETVREASAETFRHAAAYRDCALQSGDFQCKAPADRLLTACESLSSRLQ